MTNMHGHFYRACGLSIASDALIPGFCSLESIGQPDVILTMRGTRPIEQDVADATIWYTSPELDLSGKPEMTIEAGESAYRLSYGDNATFLIDRAGHRITAHWAAALSDIDAVSYLAGSVLAFVLRLRGSVPLHASAVAIDGGAVLFVGESWSGKSSIAAAFSTLGHALLSDDIVRIDASDEGLVAFPGHPRLHVWSDSARMVFGASDVLPVHSDTYRKHYLDVLEAGYRFQATPVPIDSVYLLEERVATYQMPAVVPPRQALMALVRHTYGNCFLDAGMRLREFEVLGRLVDRVPVRELRLGDNLPELASSCRALAQDGRSRRTGPAN